MNCCCWLWVALLVLVRFGSFRVVANFSTAERYKYLFFTAMEIHTMACIVKKQNNFILSWLVTYLNLSDVFLLYCRVWNNCTGIIIKFVLKSSLYDAYMRLCDYQFYWLISPARLIHSAQSFSFELKRNRYSNSLLISNIKNIWFTMNLYLFWCS